MASSNVKSYSIKISTVDDVKTFVAIASKYACRATIESGRYIVDAKSIMGVLSLDVSKPVTLVLEKSKNGVDDRDEFYKAIEKFICS